MADLREALEARYDELAAAPAEPALDAAPEAEPVASAELDPAPAPQDGAPQPASEGTRDERGRFVPKAGVKPGAIAPTDPAAAEAKPLGAKPAAAAPAAEPVKPAAARPPQSWSPTLREKFAGLAPEVQEYVLKREGEVTRALQESANARKFHEETLRPYEQHIRSRGQEPAAFVQSLLQTEHALATAPAGHKADLLAHLIVSYGVAPEALDQALHAKLTGQGAPQAQQAQRPQEFRDPRLDQLLAERQQRTQADAATKAEEFAKAHEFYDDVAPMMSSMLEAMARNGQRSISTEDLERVYTAACLSNPEVAGVLKQREAAKSATTAQAATQRARDAASSVRSTPAAAPVAQPANRREALERAYDKLATR